MIDFARVRRMMVDNQLRTYDITDLDVLSAMNEVPRERFVPAEMGMLAYSDQPLPVARASDGEARCMLAPMVFGRILQNLQIKEGERVLVVSSALGYEAAVIARLGARVVVAEPDAGLAVEARDILGALGVEGVDVVEVGFEEGCPDRAPFDAILVNAAVEQRPETLIGQLADHGRLAAIVGDGGRTSRASLFVRNGDVTGSRNMFDAVAPVLSVFRKEPGFVF